jgi:hypothetical protein
MYRGGNNKRDEREGERGKEKEREREREREDDREDGIERGLIMKANIETTNVIVCNASATNTINGNVCISGGIAV